MTLRAARRDPPFLARAARRHNCSPSPLAPYSSGKCPLPGFSPTWFTSHRVPGGRTVTPPAGLCGGARGCIRAHAQPGACPATELAPQGPALPPARAPLEDSADRLSRGGLCAPSPKSSAGRAKLHPPPGACRAGSLEGTRPTGTGPQMARSLADAGQAFLPGAPALSGRRGLKSVAVPGPALTSAPR